MIFLVRGCVYFSLFIALLYGSLVAAQPVAKNTVTEAERVKQLLAQMAVATRQLDYRGLFTYQHGSYQETLQVVHSVKNGTEFERLQHLTGPAREILRAGRDVGCQYIGDQLLGGRLSLLGEQAGLDRFYHFNIRGRERVAGRESWLLDVIPRDHFRYGYVLSIDNETGLLLKSFLIGRNRQILERFQFVELELGAVASAPSADVLPATSSSRRVVDHRLSGCNLEQSPDAEFWNAGWLPAGFLFTGQERKALEAEGAWRDVLMYTDGLTSFSVFIEPVPSVAVLEGTAQRGATVVYLSGLRLGDSYYRVTVVGEVPIQTAQRVAASIAVVPGASI